MQALDADKLHGQQLITLLTYICSVYYAYAYIHTHYYSEHAVALAILISLVLRRLHQQLVSEATVDPPVALHIAGVFHWSQN